MKYMLIAGEASGDLHASRLIGELRRLDAAAEFLFIGGDLMAKAAGHAPALHYRTLNVMGFSEVLRRLPAIFSTLRKAKKLLREFRPDTLILIDYPSFNLRMARAATRLGIRTDWYISPKVWAWKEWRVKKIRKYVSYMYSILPFEPDFYRSRGFDRITYVGNPSVEETEHALGHLPPRRHFQERNGLDDSRPIIALLPGSRRGEIRCNLPLMVEAARQFPDHQVVIAAAPSIPEKFYREVARDPGISLVFGATPTLLKYSAAAAVTSGTATLETALIGTPQVVCYRSNGSRLTYKIMRRLVKVNYVSLPNLIVGNKIVPELLLHECTPQAVRRELSPLLQPSPGRDWEVQGYRLMRRKLGNSVAPAYTAELIYSALQK
ncbi:MAG: lipid-A-disaccharide synthase [Muribaculaceae bacterium]|nr:lipid-A-disaccharide synthase [Muribaculaceae bacterium]